MKTPDGIAFDWITGMLYWTDAQENTINRLTKNQTKEVLVYDELDEPRAIALSPCDGVRLFIAFFFFFSFNSIICIILYGVFLTL